MSRSSLPDGRFDSKCPLKTTLEYPDQLCGRFEPNPTVSGYASQFEVIICSQRTGSFELPPNHVKWSKNETFEG